MKTRYYSYLKGNLPKGCQYCVKGEKLVLFITGLCSQHCFYCPISEKKKNKDVIYANERPIKHFKDIVEEAKLCSAKGAGITGGDPLVKLNRTCSYIRKLKKELGKKFHIHLYTPLNLINENSLKKLFDAGLDEIRFHPSLEDKKLWNKIKLIKKYNWEVGVEIPVIPGKEKITQELIDFISKNIDFLNLNELEYSDTNANRLTELGYYTKDNLSYGIRGSQKLGLKLLKNNKIKNVHYCTAKLKDKVQLTNRIKLRAKNIKKRYDLITDEGLLFRGVIYSDKDLNKLKKELQDEFNIPDSLIEVDSKKKRILTGSWIINELKKKLKKKELKIALIEEYPTSDQLEVVVDYL